MAADGSGLLLRSMFAWGILLRTRRLAARGLAILFTDRLALSEARDAFEKSYFEFHLAQEGGSMTRVAEKTGLERTHLYRKLKQLGVDLTRNKRGVA